MTVLLFVAAFPPFDVAEAAYLFAVPSIVWASFPNKGRRYYWTVLVANWVAWILVLIWLRHVHPPWGAMGGILLAGAVSLFATAWFALVGRVLPRMLEKGGVYHWLGLFALAGAWVVLEWVRSWFLTGFLWLPLAASQWLRPALLQPAAWTGAYGVSFILILFNLGLFFYGRRMYLRIAQRGAERSGEKRVGGWMIYFCAEFYVALFFLLGAVGLFLAKIPKTENQEAMFSAGIVQPWIAPLLKWDESMVLEHLEVLKKHTQFAALLEPDVVLWPEAATAIPIISSSDDGMRRWVEYLVRDIGIPVLSGHMAERDDVWQNGIFLTEPETGLHPVSYAKQRLVPFGEYVPFRAFLPFIDKVVPIDGDVHPGGETLTIPLTVKDRTWTVGSMVCYEDIFPQLAREMVKAGAECLFVVTNDAWYGQEGGAYQHAAHSVLRAVETRRPIMRCGNHGWSGWIDEYGHRREVLTNDSGTIYFRGVGDIHLARDSQWVGRESFYVAHGDWFVGLCGVGMCCFWAWGFFQRKRTGD